MLVDDGWINLQSRHRNIYTWITLVFAHMTFVMLYEPSYSAESAPSLT